MGGGYELFALNMNLQSGYVIACFSTSLLQPFSPSRQACPINVGVVAPFSPLISHSSGSTEAPTEQVKLEDVLRTWATYRSIGSPEATADGVNVTNATFEVDIATLIALSAVRNQKLFQFFPTGMRRIYTTYLSEWSTPSLSKISYIQWSYAAMRKR